MARRHLTLTLDLTIDNDLAEAAQQFGPDGTSDYSDTINEFRTTIHTAAQYAFARYNPQISDPEVTRTGITPS